MMLFVSALTAAATLALLSIAAPVLDSRGTDSGNVALAIGGGRFNANELQTFKLSYANSSAWLGRIKHKLYSEPLVVSTGDGGLSFLSIHSASNASQEAYIVPHQTQPIGFSPPHGTPPQGVRTTGWAFDGNGVLVNNGHNLFYACQNAGQAAISSYQIWWWGAGEPNGVSCKGPLAIRQADACARS